MCVDDVGTTQSNSRPWKLIELIELISDMDQYTYENTIFSGLFTSINPSYFDVNRRGTIGFDTLPGAVPPAAPRQYLG